MSRPMPFAEILCHTPAFASLIEHTSALATLEGLFQKKLPPVLKAHCRVNQLEDETLKVAVRSPAVAGRLRQFEHRIAADFNAAGMPFKWMKVQVAPHLFEQAALPSNTPPRTIGPKGREVIARWAETLPPSPLKETLSRLSERYPYAQQSPPETKS